MGKKNNLTIIGLDGCELDYLLKWIETGDLPFLKKTIEFGTFGSLKSTIPPTTFPAWPSMFTGKNPGKLGAFDFFKLEETELGYNQKLINSRIWQGDLIWDIASRFSKMTGVINAPFFTPTEINGYMIDLHMDHYNPSELKNEISLHIDSFKEFDYKIHAIKSSELSRLKQNTSIEFEVGNYLRASNIDFFIQVFNILDGTAHSTQSLQIVKDRYMYVDRKLEEYYDDDNTNMLIVSDHGMKKVKYRYYINKWLEDKKYLYLQPVYKSKFNTFSKRISYEVTNLFPSLEFYLNDIANILGRKISPLKNLRNKESETKEHGYATSYVDWKKTMVYAHASNASNYMGLWVRNYDDKIKFDLLKELKDIRYGREGNYLIKNIFERDEIYKGSERKELPHLVLEVQDEVLAHSAMAPILYRSTGTFAHDLFGTFIACGPDIKAGHEIFGAEVIDVTPTVLHLLGVPIPEDIDGKVLMEIFH